MAEHPTPASVPTPKSLHAASGPDEVATVELAQLTAATARFRDDQDENPESVVRAAIAAASELERALDRSGS